MKVLESGGVVFSARCCRRNQAPFSKAKAVEPVDNGIPGDAELRRANGDGQKLGAHCMQLHIPIDGVQFIS